MKRKIAMAMLAVAFVLSGCGDDEEIEIVGTWMAPALNTSGYSYVTHNYTSNHSFQLCKNGLDNVSVKCDEKLTYRLENGKIILSDGTMMLYEIITKDKKKHLIYFLDESRSEFTDFVKID